MDESWRAGLPVLVPEAGSLGAIGVIRSLGRAGYPVHGCASNPEALGLRSRYCRAASVCPSYDRPDFLDWLGEYVRRHGIRAIIPSEAFLLAIRPAFAEYRALLPLAADEEVLYRGLSKSDVHRSLSTAGGEAGANLPPSLLVESSGPEVVEDDLQGLGAPLFLKVDGLHSLLGEPGRVVRAETAVEASRALAALRPRFAKVLVQGYVPGRGIGSFFLVREGAVLAEFQHRRLHEVPHTGGISSLRESCQIPPIRDDALAKLHRLGWSGVGMLEYRHDEVGGGFWFIEFNGRFWGSLHLALHAGVDFPALLVDAFHGHRQPPPRARLGVRCRKTFPEEVQYVWSRVRDRRLGLGAQAWSVLEFVLLSVDRRIYRDLLYPGDRRLWGLAARRSLATWCGAIARRFGPRGRMSDV
jgi:hypothetical protein